MSATSASPNPTTHLLKGASHFNAPIDRIRPGRGQPRQYFDPEELADLARSIQQMGGMMHPLVVCKAESVSTFMLITGERRLRAAKIAGLGVVPCLVLARKPQPDEILGLQLTENILRQDLKPVEEAEAYQTLMTLQRWDQRRLARFLGISDSSIHRRFALLKLSGAIKAQVDAGELAPDSAYQISRAPEVDQDALARRVIQEGLKRSQVAAESRRLRDQRTAARSPAKPPPGPPPGRSSGTQKIIQGSPPTSKMTPTSASRPSLADVWLSLQGELLEECGSLFAASVPQGQSTTALDFVREVLSALNTEEQTLGPDLEDLMALIAVLLAKKLGVLTDKKSKTNEAALRALNRLSVQISTIIGSLRAKK